MAKKKTRALEIIKVIRRKDIPLAIKRKAVKEVRAIEAEGSCSFHDSGYLGTCFVWSESPSGQKFWEGICQASSKTA